MKSTSGLVCLALALSAFSANANELLVTTGSAKSGVQTFAIDLVSSGAVSAFNFSVRFGGDVGAVETKNCVSDLPKGFSGACNLKDGILYISAIADGMTSLPAGVVSVGTVSIPSGMAKRAASPVIENLEMVGVDGTVLESTSQLAK